MANMGDLVTRLIADSTQYTAGTKSAVASNTELHGSVNSIIGQLMRKKKALEDVGKTTLDWIAADKAASEEVKEHARSLLMQVDALKKLASASNDPILRMMNATRETNDPFQVGLRRMGNTKVADDAAAAKDAADPFLSGMARWQKENDSWQRGMNQMRSNHAAEMAERDRQAKERREQQERDANDPFLKGMKKYQEEQDPFQKGLGRMKSDKDAEEADKQYRINAARKRDVFEAEDAAEKENQNRIRQQQNDNRNRRRQEQEEERRHLDDVRENSRRMAQHRRDDINVQKQIAESRKAVVDTQAKSGRLNFAGIELGRAIEDFTQGSVYGGLKGGFLAASNNISQMFIGLQSQMQGSTSRMGQMMANYGGVIGSAISTTMILGITAYDAWNKSKSGSDGATQGASKFTEQISSAIAKLKELRGDERELMNIDREESPQALKGKLRTTTEERLEVDREVADRAKLMRDKLVALGLAGPGGQVDANALQMAVGNAQGALGNQDLFAAVGVGGDLVKVNPAATTPEFIAQLRKEEEQVFLLRQKSVQLSEQEKKIRENIPLLEQQQNSLATQFAKNKRQADFDAMKERGKVAMQSRSEDLLLSGMKDEKDRAAFRAEKEHQESLRRSAEAERLGFMKPDERQKMDKDSLAKRDRDIREAKFGSLQADGSTGFGSADIKSTQGFNAAIKAMTYSQQTDTIAWLKKNGDIAAEQLAAQQQTNEILKMAPLPVVDF